MRRAQIQPARLGSGGFPAVAGANDKMPLMQEWDAALRERFGETDGFAVSVALGEVGLSVPAAAVEKTLTVLRDDFNFSQLIDLAGVDYSQYHGHDGKRYAVVYHLLSLTDNRRLRVRAFCDDDEFPALASATGVWAAADWYEREAFDLYGIVFHGHHDLRRLLTDYGFVGHPFRKDFPLSGHVEMRYDPVQKRVVYQPVSIEPREVTPRVVREGGYGGDG